MLYRLLLAGVLATSGMSYWTSTPVAAAYAPIVVAQAALPPLFNMESEAQAHCPKDVVVWLNIPSGIYHYKVERWYGHTKHGAYACEKEAIKGETVRAKTANRRSAPT